MNPFAGGGQNNLYRCFIDLAFRQIAPAGYAGLIHQDGHLTDPNSGSFRTHWYARIVKHFHLRNEIKSKNFSEVDNHTDFSVNIYRGKHDTLAFENLTSAFLSSQIEESYSHDGSGPLPAIKTRDGKWETRGHRDRIVMIDHAAMEVIHALMESKETPIEEARFVPPYSPKMLEVFRAIAAAPSLAEAVDYVRITRETLDGYVIESVPGWQISKIWHESEAQWKLRTIRRETRFHDDSDNLVISGPMFHVGNPIYKSPREGCKSNKDYDIVDLIAIPNDYIPRTNYAPAVAMQDYCNQLPHCRWDPTKSHVDFYRVAFRNMIALNGERSLIGAVLPKGIAHVHTVESLAFDQASDLLIACSLFLAIPFDYLVKCFGQGHFHDSTVKIMPFFDPGDTAKHRGLRLACLTTGYADLWNQQAPTLVPLPWHSSDPRLSLDAGPIDGPAVWDHAAALRTDFARRMALVEIDVLVAQALGLNLDQLIEIYRIYFPVLQENEAGTWYDRNGRIAWTCSMGLPGIGYLEDGKRPSSNRWSQILQSGETHLACEAVVDFLPNGPNRVTRTFDGPFDTCDRVQDYKCAWPYFEAHQSRAAG